MSYWRFFGMIGTSTLVMFALMYLNTYLWPHLFYSETRAYMAVLMGAAMAIIMLCFMMSMYANRAANIAILPWKRRSTGWQVSISPRSGSTTRTG